MTCAEYAKREKLNAATLSWWAWKLRASGEDVPGSRRSSAGSGKRRPARRDVAFVEVTPAVEPASSRRELEAAGVVIRLPTSFDDAHLVRVLDVLEGRR